MNNKTDSEQNFVSFCQLIFKISVKEEKNAKRRRRERKQRKDKERKGKKGSSNERLDCATSTRILVGNRLHV